METAIRSPLKFFLKKRQEDKKFFFFFRSGVEF